MKRTFRRNPRVALMAIAAAVVASTAVALSPGIGAGQTTPTTDAQTTPTTDASTAIPTAPPAAQAAATASKGHDDGVQSAVLSNTTISTPGALNNIFLSNEGNCQVDHVGDADHEFFDPSSVPGACATLIATGGTLFGPSVIPAGGSATPRTTFTSISQSAVTGSGTDADPFKVVTVLDAGGTGLRLTETDSYVVGTELYRTDVQVSNTGAVPRSFVLYRAGDCFLQNSDSGFGDLLPNGDVGCRASEDGITPGLRIERWIPITPGSSSFEENFDAVWDWIGTQAPFPNTCVCTTFTDNGAGLSWSAALGAGASATFSHTTIFSPTGGVVATPRFAG
jgi:hypothetical protein